MNHLVEYLILSYALEYQETFRNLVWDWQLTHTELIATANSLFQNGDIRANILHESGKIATADVVLTKPEIQASLDGKLAAVYYLTPQGGERWSAIASADWNKYFLWSGFIGEESEIISLDRQLIEELIKYSGYLHSEIPVSGTEVWDVVEPWQATYWKVFPKAYKVRYQGKKLKFSISSNTPKEFINTWEEAKKWYAEIRRWYVTPSFETNPPDPADYYDLSFYAPPSQTAIEEAKYFILKQAVNCEVSLTLTAYNCNLSHAEIVRAADFLFQSGDILAKIFDERGVEVASGVILNKTGIQDCLNYQLASCYYLTSQGGARWESMASPDWSKFLNIENFDCPGQGLLVGATKNIVEKFLALDCFLAVSYKHIPGTEVWQVLEPWPATYWKTLPRGYQVAYKNHPANFLEEHFQKAFELKEAAPASLLYSHDMARQWRYELIDKWYRNPFDERIT